MSIIENVYFDAKQFRQDSPAWCRLEKYDNCDVKSLSPKRGFFTRLFGKKRTK